MPPNEDDFPDCPTCGHTIPIAMDWNTLGETLSCAYCGSRAIVSWDDMYDPETHEALGGFYMEKADA